MGDRVDYFPVDPGEAGFTKVDLGEHATGDLEPGAETWEGPDAQGISVGDIVSGSSMGGEPYRDGTVVGKNQDGDYIIAGARDQESIEHSTVILSPDRVYRGETAPDSE